MQEGENDAHVALLRRLFTPAVLDGARGGRFDGTAMGTLRWLEIDVTDHGGDRRKLSVVYGDDGPRRFVFAWRHLEAWAAAYPRRVPPDPRQPFHGDRAWFERRRRFP